MVKIPKTYYCVKCKRNHKSGKIYEEHKKYVEKEEVEIPTDKILLSWDQIRSLRSIAQRQIARLWKRAKLTKRFSLYIREINRVIIYEQK